MHRLLAASLSLAVTVAGLVLIAATPAAADTRVSLPNGSCVVIDTSEAFTVYECSGVPYISLPNHL